LKVLPSLVSVGGEPPRRPWAEPSPLADRWHIIGVGSPVVGDDFGWLAIDALRVAGLADAHELRTLDRPGAALIEHLIPGARVILLDAMEAGLPPGSVRELDLEDLIARAHPPSSHQLGLAETLALARALGEWPKRLHLLGIQRVSGSTSAESEGFEDAAHDHLGLEAVSPYRDSEGPDNAGFDSGTFGIVRLNHTGTLQTGSLDTVRSDSAAFDSMGTDTDGLAPTGGDWRQRACADVVARVRSLLEAHPG